MNKYGHFDTQNREFVITNPCTPAPWINYLHGDKMKALISQGAGGVAWYDNPAYGRLTRYRVSGLPVDSPGFYIYLKHKDYIWNPSYFPTMSKLDKYECRHGLNYTRFTSEKNGIEAMVTYFMPHDSNIFLWDTRLRNKSRSAQKLKLYTYLEFTLHRFEGDTLWFYCENNQFHGYFDRSINGIVLDMYRDPFKGKSVFSSSEKITAYDIDRDLFIGQGRNESNPLGLEKGLANSDVKDGGHYFCGVLENVLTLKPGETRNVTYKYAVSESLAETKKIIRRYNSRARIDGALKGVKDYWKERLSSAQVNTPDKNVNELLNTWIPYNIKYCYKLLRAITIKHPGASAYLQYRDSMQDVMSWLVFSHEEGKKRLSELFPVMLENGMALFAINLITKKNAIPDKIRIDNALWGIYAIYNYLAETGDFGFLEEVLPYNDKGEGTVLEHCIKSLKFLSENTGSHGITLLMGLDWNDSIKALTSIDERNETVMVAQQYLYAARLLVEILKKTNKPEEVPYFENKIKSFTDIINSDACWDGSWFRRVLGVDRYWGGKKNDYAKIFLNTQSWAAIAGTLDQAKVKTAMNNAYKILNTKYGLRLFYPPMEHPERLVSKDPGRHVTCNAGAGENGGIFFHANTWAIIAQALLGNGDIAWEIFSKVLPANLSNRNPDRYKFEPYAFATWVYGPDHKYCGEAMFTWNTGGAAWIYPAGVNYILGVRPTLEGLCISPAIPKKWESYSVRKKFRGCIFNITVKNPEYISSGNVKISVDGKPIEGNIIPPITGKKEVEVTVVMSTEWGDVVKKTK